MGVGVLQVFEAEVELFHDEVALGTFEEFLTCLIPSLRFLSMLGL